MTLSEFLYPDLKRIVVAKIFVLPVIFLEVAGIQTMNGVVQAIIFISAVYIFACFVSYKKTNEEVAGC